MQRTVLFLFFVFTILGSCSQAADPIKADILLKGGLVYDGTSQKPFVADVAIAGDRIVGIGEIEVDPIWTIDCSGLVVCPGFIDLHNHSDNQIVRAGTRANMNYVRQGCTTIVTGNCGSGPVDVAAFYEKIETHGAGTNVAHLLPQGSLRRQVMGSDLRKPTAAEKTKMLSLTEKAMADGAWGMSTGLIYVPSSYATTDEITAIAKVVSKHGGIYASHIRGEGSGLMSSIEEAISIGKQAKLPVHISHFKSSGRSNWGLVRQAAVRIQQERDKGSIVTADQYPYIASSTSLQATLLPSWARAGGTKKLIERLDDKETGPRLRAIVEEAIAARKGGDAVRIARYTPKKEWVGKSLLDIAKLEKKSVLDIAYEVFRGGRAQIVNFSMSEEDVRHIMAIDWVATASDGRAYLPGADKPHPRNYGTFPRKIGHYAVREEVISVAHAIRSATGLPADILSLPERGYLKKGFFADIVVFKQQELIDQATFDEPHQYCAGIQYVLVNGKPAIANASATGTLAGKPLRHNVPLAE
jgi:N-acyl-D-aspartate/D-glutamate deacylase